MATLPTFSLEKRLWKKKNKFIIGVDEVGRGALAGPVVAAAVAFNQKDVGLIKNLGINDSKKLRPKIREILEKEIKKSSLSYAVTSTSVSVINHLGIVKATEKAMRKAVKMVIKKLKQGAKKEPKVFVIIDGFHVKYIPGVTLKNQKNIYDGDRKSISIASASILAKVYRDKLMEKLAKRGGFKKYGWEKNKGYGTKKHQMAILKYGITSLHRKKFLEKLLSS